MARAFIRPGSSRYVDGLYSLQINEILLILGASSFAVLKNSPVDYLVSP
jgi:hypothetical protein